MVLFGCSLHAFDDGGRGHAAARAHRGHAAMQVTPFHFIKQCAQDDGTGCPNGVTQRHGTAIDVDLVIVEVEHPHEAQNPTVLDLKSKNAKNTRGA